MDCNAIIDYDNFVIRDDRIYYQRLSGLPEFYTGNAKMTLLSMAADGTDKKLEYVFDEDAPTSVARAMSFLSAQYWLYKEAPFYAYLTGNIVGALSERPVVLQTKSHRWRR